MSIPSRARRRRMTLLAGWACALVLQFAAPAASAEERGPVRIAVEGAFPPFNYLDAKNELQGFDLEIAHALCEAGQFRCELVMHTWDNIIPDLLAGQYDVILSSMSMSAERRKQVAFSDTYYTSPSVFITKKGDVMSDIAPEAMKGRRIGVTFDTAQAAYIDTFYRPVAEITVFPNSPDLYKGLADGDVDIILEDKLAVFDWLTNTKLGQCCDFTGPDILDTTYFGDGAGIAFRPADKELLGRFNAALADIKANGAYDMINAKYFPFSIQ